MALPSPLPSSKVAKYSTATSKIVPPYEESPLRSGHFYMKGAHCAEPNEKSIFLSIFLELWLILFTIFKCVTDQKWPIKIIIIQKWTNLQERCTLCWNELKISFPISSFWDMVVQNLTIWLKIKNHPKRCSMLWNGILNPRVFFLCDF